MMIQNGRVVQDSLVVVIHSAVVVPVTIMTVSLQSGSPRPSHHSQHILQNNNFLKKIYFSTLEDRLHNYI